jgi:hypothetical protein
MAPKKATPKHAMTRDVGVEVPTMPGAYSVFENDARPALLNGQPTVDGRALPVGFEHAIPFANTDQGRWDTNHGENVRKPSGITMGKDPLAKAMDQRLDQPWAEIDPLKSAIDLVREPGMRYRALSKAVCDKRGQRGWETVVDKNGDQVKVGRLFLGQMPESVAEKRNAHYQKIGSEDLKNVEENFAIDQEKIIREMGGKGVSTLRHGDLLTADGDPSRGASVGFDQIRGGG